MATVPYLPWSSDEGVVQFEASELSCYERDHGGGHACNDEMVAMLEINRTQIAQ